MVYSDAGNVIDAYSSLPDIGITFGRFTAAFLTLGLNSGAYQAEYLRGALQAVSEGQMTAARAIGMSKAQAIRYIILPQALRLVLPAWSNEAISMLKYTAVVFLIAVPDLMTQAKILFLSSTSPHSHKPVRHPPARPAKLPLAG